MQLPSLLGHVQELLGTILATHFGSASQIRVPANTATKMAGRPADSLIDTFFRTRRYLGSHDRRFIAETTYGTLRHLRRAQVVTEQALATANQPATDEDNLLLTIAAYLVNVERRADITPEVLEPKLASPQLKDSLAFVLKQFAETNHLPTTDDAERLGVAYSYPDWLTRKLLSEHGAGTERLMASLNEQAPLTLRVNTLKASVEECQSALKSEGIETTRTAHSPVGLNVAKRLNIFSLQAFRNGMFEVQDEGSQLLPLLIDPKPTAKVLDACAGAGGKTLALAAIMRNRGEIFATDVHDRRLDELRKRSKRAGVSNVRVRVVEEIGDLARPDEAPASRSGGDFTSYFDVVLVDAPCSGLGTIRRNPGMKWSVTEEMVRELSEKQSHILGQSAQLVKPGGRLIYATCTMLSDENEGVVEGFLSRHDEFAVADVSALVSKFGLSSAVSGKYIKLQPHVHGTDGFFCAVMERKQ